MLNKKPHTNLSLLTLLSLLSLVSCTDEQNTSSSSSNHPLTFAVTEQGWRSNYVQLTRSTTLDALQASDAGFGIYFTLGDLTLANQHVTWDDTQSKWNYGNTIIWPIEQKIPANFTVYAYAPYDADGTYADGSTVAFDNENNQLTFTPANDNQTDLLWANSSRDNDVMSLHFQHPLAKISFGTITNNYGRDITLKSIEVSGVFYTKGRLSLTNGTWGQAWENLESDGTKTITRPDINLNVADGATEVITTNPILQIPTPDAASGPDATIIFTFNTTDFGDETATFTIPLERGKDKELNLTITNNFEVVWNE